MADLRKAFLSCLLFLFAPLHLVLQRASLSVCGRHLAQLSCPRLQKGTRDRTVQLKFHKETYWVVLQGELPVGPLELGV